MDTALLVKLASLVVHVQEGVEDGGHAFDFAAASALANDPQVVEWVASLDPVLLPERRAALGRDET